MRPWIFAALVLGIATVHWLVYVGLFGVGFALGDAGAHGLGPTLVGIAVGVLGVPLMYLLFLPPAAFGSSRWWGDDSNFILMLAALNALVWGCTLAWLIRRRSRKAGEAA